MPMTKKERAEYDAAIHRAELLAALRWTEEVLPDVPPPDESAPRGTETHGFTIYASSNIAPMKSSAFDHSNESDTEFRYRDPIALFSTKLLALKAHRHAVTKESAEKLLAIDDRIKAAEKGMP